jgi:hypothetical protein
MSYRFSGWLKERDWTLHTCEGMCTFLLITVNTFRTVKVHLQIRWTCPYAWRYSLLHSFPWHYVKASGQFKAMAALPPIESPPGTQCIGDSMGCTAGLEILLPLLGIKPWFLTHSAHSLVQRCWTHGMQHSLLFQLFYFSCLTTVSIL